MMSFDRRAPRGLMWAVIGGVVLLAGVIAIIIASLLTPQGTGPTGTPEPPDTGSTSPSPLVSTSEGQVVDASVTGRGWVPEPITTDPEVYAKAALAAASTFDTTLSGRDEWLDYLDTWFTLDTRYADESDRAAELAAAQLELRQGVVLPEEQWDSLAAEEGRVVAAVQGDVSVQSVPDDPSGDMSIGTADVVLTYTRSDGAGAESSYDETVRVSVQILCGPDSAPTPDSAQQAGDCKVVRYFTEPMEP